VEDTRVDVGKLFGVLAEQLRQNGLVAAIAVMILVAGNLALDGLGATSSMAPAGFLSLAVQLHVTRSALSRAGQLSTQSKSKFLSFWGMNIVTSIAILLGCLLLLIPGLYLAARWSVAGPAIIAEDLSAGGGMRVSWERTRATAWHLAGAFLIVFGGAFVAAMVPSFLYSENRAPVVVQIISYLFIFGGTVCGWLMAVGAYGLLSGRQESLAQVFA
jgi:hypothetical protein